MRGKIRAGRRGEDGGYKLREAARRLRRMGRVAGEHVRNGNRKSARGKQFGEK